MSAATNFNPTVYAETSGEVLALWEAIPYGERPVRRVRQTPDWVAVYHILRVPGSP